MAGGYSRHTRYYKTAPPHPVVRVLGWLFLAAFVAGAIYLARVHPSNTKNGALPPQAMHLVT